MIATGCQFCCFYAYYRKNSIHLSHRHHVCSIWYGMHSSLSCSLWYITPLSTTYSISWHNIVPHPLCCHLLAKSSAPPKPVWEFWQFLGPKMECLLLLWARVLSMQDGVGSFYRQCFFVTNESLFMWVLPHRSAAGMAIFHFLMSCVCIWQ